MEKKFMFIVTDRDGDICGVFESMELAQGWIAEHLDEVFNTVGYELNVGY